MTPDGICPNVRCVREKGLTSCADCPEMEKCETGFYSSTDTGAVNLAKAGAMFIRKYGASAFVSLLNYILIEKKTRNDRYFTDKSDMYRLFAEMEKLY